MMKKEIPFTQYLLPNGRAEQISIMMSQKIADIAHKIIEKGNRFEAEILTTGEVSLTIHNIEFEEDVAIELCENGLEVYGAVERLINKYSINDLIDKF